jgi:beta-glucanase (GH16 family)
VGFQTPGRFRPRPVPVREGAPARVATACVEPLEARALASASVVGRHVFYNNSAYDGWRASADEADDAAIAPDKSALLPGKPITAANFTTYSRGINGIMVDVAGLPAGGASVSADDFEFRVGNNADPSGWAEAPAPSSVTVRPAPDAEGVWRVTATWTSRAIRNTWLRVSVRADADTGLAAPDVFYFGNLMGEAGEGEAAAVGAADALAVRRSLGRTSSLEGDFDFDRDGRVGRSDMWVARSNAEATLFGRSPFAEDLPSAPDEPAPPVAGAWRSVFRDEFDDAALDPVWHTAQWWDRTVTVVGDGELQAYAPSGVSVGAGMLHLTARKDSRYGAPYVSGMVMTGGNDSDSNEPRFNFLYGYMEVRAKLPPGQGMWPAIWMMPASYDDGNGEMDVLEVVGSTPREANFSLHRRGRGDTDDWVGPDFSQGFHTFGVDWQADHVAWYVDGVERARMTDRGLICPEAMYPIINLAIGGDWGGPPNASTVFPATMDVDYVRIWQRDGSA